MVLLHSNVLNITKWIVVIVNLSMDWVSTIISITKHGFSHGLIFNSVPHTPF